MKNTLRHLECSSLQQYLPFTVLKHHYKIVLLNVCLQVATVLTVYGIETRKRNRSDKKKQSLVATVLTVYGIETELFADKAVNYARVATVLTVYGIETGDH